MELFDENGDTTALVETDAAGAYTFSDLPPGTFFVATFNVQGYVDEVYNDILCPGGGFVGCDPAVGTPVVVSAGTIISGIDFALDQGGTISGTITNAVSGTPISDGLIEFWDVNGSLINSAFTNTEGAYSSGGLPTGSYFASTSIAFSSLNPEPYLNELYDNISCSEGGDVSCDPVTGSSISVTAGLTTLGIDFALDVKDADSIEPNDNAASATVVSCGDSLSAVSIIPSRDVDFYALSLSAGQILSVSSDVGDSWWSKEFFGLTIWHP